MSSSGLPSANRTTRLVISCLLVIAFVSIASFFVFKNVADLGDKTFAAAAVAHRAPLHVYIDVLAIDPVRESMALRLNIVSGSGSHDTQYQAALHRDVVLGVGDGETQQEYRFQRDVPASSREFAASLQGSVGLYPFDSYSTQIVTVARDLSEKSGALSMPLQLTFWGGVSGWAVRAVKVQSSPQSTELALAFSIRRPAPLVFFACVLYGIMMLIAASAMIIGTLIFVGIRRVEPTLISALAAMAFALPALRNVMPGAPPLGVAADVVIVLWAELAVAVGLALIVAAWTRRGST